MENPGIQGRCRLSLGATAACLLAAARLAAADFFVDFDHLGGDGSGDSWNNALTTLQDGLDLAGSDDVIHLAEGIYYPDEGAGRVNNNAGESFIMSSGMTLLGGYEPSGTARGRDPELFPTILSGDIAQTLDSDNDGYVDLFGATLSTRLMTLDSLSDSVVLDGLGITGGGTTGIDGYQSSLELRDCTVRGNKGRAVVMQDPRSTPEEALIVADCLFTYNGSGQASSGGGAISVEGVDLRVDRSDFLANQNGLASGGAIASRGDPDATRAVTLEVRQCRIKGNRAVNGGGASMTGRVNAIFDSCVISGNRAGNAGVLSSGGGIYQVPLVNGGGQFLTAPATFMNCTIAWNVCTTTGGGIHFSGPSPKNVINSLFFKNYIGPDFTDPACGSVVVGGGAAARYYNCYDLGDTLPGTSNIDWLMVGFPTFEQDVALTTAPGDTVYQPSTSGDLRLQQGSTLINGGDNQFLSLSTDLAGNPRIINGTVDLGAYETVDPPVITITKVLKVPGSGGPKIRIEFDADTPVDVFTSPDLNGFGSSPVATGQSSPFEKPISLAREFFILVPQGESP